MRTWTLHFRYEEAHSSCFAGLSRLLGFPRVSIRFGLLAVSSAPRGRTRALVSSLTSGLPPTFLRLRALPAGLSQKELLKSGDARRTKPPPPSVERLSARLRYLSSLLLVAKDDRDREGKRGAREKDPLFSPSPNRVEINDVPSTKDACLKRSKLASSPFLPFG